MKNPLKILRNKWGLFLSLFLLAAVSCDDELLDQENPNAPTPATFWKTALDAERGIIGVYSPITGVQYYGRMFVFSSLYRDDIVNGFAVSPRTAAGRFQGDSNVPATVVCWNEGWKVIARANELLLNVPDIPIEECSASGFTPDDKNGIIGEALFLRSFVYFDLVNNYRNIPLITSVLTVEEANSVSQAPPADVYTQIISDLQQARGFLPRTRTGSRVGRATWGAASALLGKVYMMIGQFSDAEAVFGEVVNSGVYSLVDNYADNFRMTTEINSESVLEWQMTFDGNTGWGGDAANTGRANSILPDLAPQGFTNQNGMRVNQWALDLFLDEQTVNGEIDPRTFNTFFWNTTETTTYRGETLSSVTYGNQDYASVFGPDDTRIFASKYVLADAEEGNASSNFHQTDSNLRVIRFADVLLYYAEAGMMANGGAITAAGLDAINLVRARADMPAFDNSITFQDIQDERVKELALEHYRYYDLLRWGIVKERLVDIPDLKDESGGVGAYQPGREYMDIPQKDLDINPNLTRNPGY